LNFKHITTKEYFNHMLYVSNISFILVGLGVIGLLHGIFPFLFTNFVSSKVKHLSNMLDGRS